MEFLTVGGLSPTRPTDRSIPGTYSQPRILRSGSEFVFVLGDWVLM
jgi:hypothetical protein